MSRIGKVPIKLPQKVKVAIENGSVCLEGDLGKLSLDIPHGIQVEKKEDLLNVSRTSDTKQNRSSHGTIRALLTNMIKGVAQGHKKELEMQGVGFRSEIKGTKLVLNLGFSHPVEYPIPEGVKVSVPQPTAIIIEGCDKVLVGEVAAEIRDFKRPEPYKGKGIRYKNEIVRRKQGKSVTK